MTSDTEGSGLSAFFKIRLTTLSIVLLCVTVSAVASLAVVATITRADVLSTVALALAVLAFAAQLIVTIAAAQASANQTRDTFEINAQTQAILADIQAQAQALITVQTTQFEKLLERAINPQNVADALAIAATSDEDGQALELDPAVLANQLRSVVEGAIARTDPRKVWRVTLNSSPSAARNVLTDFLRLSPVAQDLLRRSFELGNLPHDAMALEDARDELTALDFIETQAVMSTEGRLYERGFLTSKSELIREIADPLNPERWTEDIRWTLHERFGAVKGSASPSPTE